MKGIVKAQTDSYLNEKEKLKALKSPTITALETGGISLNNFNEKDKSGCRTLSTNSLDKLKGIVGINTDAYLNKSEKTDSISTCSPDELDSLKGMVNNYKNSYLNQPGKTKQNVISPTLAKLGGSATLPTGLCFLMILL